MLQDLEVDVVHNVSKRRRGKENEGGKGNITKGKKIEREGEERSMHGVF